MSNGLEEQTSLQLAVAREFSKNHRLFRVLKKRALYTRPSNLDKLYSEELDSGKQHPHPENNSGFS